MSDILEPETAVALVARAGTAQRLKYRITPQPGSLMSAKGIGGQLTALADLMETLAKEDGGPRVHVLVPTITTDPADGSVCFDLLVCPNAEDMQRSIEKKEVAP